MKTTWFRQSPRTAQARRQFGFTAIEMMVVMTLLAILATLALPGFRDIQERYRLRRAVEELTATIYFARTEAIKRGGRVVLRKTNPTPAGCTTAGTNQAWSCGWMVFIDANDNGVFNSGETVLQTSPIPTGIDVNETAQRASLRVDRWGNFGGAGAVGFALRSQTSPLLSYATALCLSAGGRLRIIKEAAACTQ